MPAASRNTRAKARARRDARAAHALAAAKPTLPAPLAPPAPPVTATAAAATAAPTATATTTTATATAVTAADNAAFLADVNARVNKAVADAEDKDLLNQFAGKIVQSAYLIIAGPPVGGVVDNFVYDFVCETVDQLIERGELASASLKDLVAIVCRCYRDFIDGDASD